MRERQKRHGIRQKKQQDEITVEEGWHVQIEREEERQFWEGIEMEGHNYRINSNYYLFCEDWRNFLIISLILFPVLCTNLSPIHPCFELSIAGESRGPSLLGMVGGPIIA